MSASTFIIWAADTSALTGPPTMVASSATSGTVKTILQGKSGVAKSRVIEWGYTLDNPAASNVKIELVETGTIFGTVTTIGSGIRPYGDCNGVSNWVAGTAATGFNASAEGTVTASRLFDFQYENGLYVKKQFPLGRECEIAPSSALRVRVTPTSNAAVNIMPYFIIEE